MDRSRPARSFAARSRDGFGSNSSLLGVKPLNVLGIFAVGVLGRTLLKSFLGEAATPVILLLLGGYVYYLKAKEQEKQEINKQK